MEASVKGGGRLAPDTLASHACLAKVTVAMHCKEKTTAIVYIEIIHSNAFIINYYMPITCQSA